MNNFTHTLSAYEIGFHKRRGSDSGDSEKLDIKSIATLLISSFDNNDICKETGYIIKLNKIESDTLIDGGIERILIKPDSGRRDRPTTMYPTFPGNKHPYTFGSGWASTYSNNVFLYQFPNHRIFCIFHRVGKSGCKTIFKAQCNELLKPKGIMMEMSWIPPKSAQQSSEVDFEYKGVKFIFREENNTSDIADRLDKQKRKGRVVRTLNLNLTAKTNSNLKEKLESLKNKVLAKKEILEEVKPLLHDEYNDLDVQISFCGLTRTVHWDDLESLFSGFDITEKLKNTSDSALLNKLTECSDEYMRLIYQDLKR